MADSFIQLSPDSTGKRVDTRTAPDGDHREVQVIGSPTTADVAEADATNGLDVDVTRIIPGTAATNLGKAVDSAAGATDSGVAALVLRDDALAALTPADGDYTHLRTDSTGALWVRDTAGATGGTAMTDDAAFTPGVTSGTPAFAFADETAPDSVDEGDAGALRMTLDRKLLTRVVGATDANRLDIDGSGHAQVDIAATSVTVPISAASLPLPTGAATLAGQTQPGVDIGDVTVNNAAGASAVNVQDGGNSLTVDGTVAVSGAVDTELPAAAALADNTANPTAPAVGAFQELWDGATWDRAPGNSTDGALVNLGANNDVTVTGSVTANAGTNLNTSALALEAGGNLAALAASASVLDDWDETNRAAVNTIAGQVGVQGGSGTINALTQRVVLATDQPTVPVSLAAGGTTQYAEDTAHVSGDLVTLAGVVQQSADAALSSDGDRSAMQVDASGWLKVNIKAGAGSGGTAMADDAAFTPATTQGTPAFGLADETAPDSVDEGDAGALRMTLDRKLLTRVVGATDANRLDVDGSGHAQVDIAAVSVTVPVSAASLPLPTGASTSALQTQPGVDIGDVTVNNAAGASAVNVQDGGNSLTVDNAALSVVGGGVEATALRVTLASDSTGLVSVDDNGGSLTVDGTVAVSGVVDTELPAAAALADNTANPTAPAVGAFGQVWDGATWDRAPGNSTDGALVNLGANNDVSLNAGTNNIGDVDVLSVIPGTGATNLGKAIDSAPGATDTGVPALVVRNDVPSGITPVDGDYTTLRVSASGKLWTSDEYSALVASAIEMFGSSTYAEGVSKAISIGAVRRDADTTLVNTTNEIAPLQVDANGRLKVEAFSGETLPVSLTSTTITGAVDTELPPAAALADNTANPTVPAVGSFLMAFDGTNWDRVQTGAATGGALKVDGSAVTQPVSGTVTANQGTAGTAWEIIGDVASDSAVPTNPVIIGARASTAQPTAVSADGDSVNIWANRKGAPIVSMAPHVGLIGDPWTLTSVTAQYTTTQTSAVLLAGGGSERIVVTKIGIQAGGTTAGTLQVYFGTGAYSRGTSLAIFDGEFAPSATLKPGVRDTGPFISATNGDDVLVTTSAAINPLTITIWYYILT